MRDGVRVWWSEETLLPSFATIASMRWWIKGWFPRGKSRGVTSWWHAIARERSIGSVREERTFPLFFPRTELFFPFSLHVSRAGILICASRVRRACGSTSVFSERGGSFTTDSEWRAIDFVSAKAKQFCRRSVRYNRALFYRLSRGLRSAGMPRFLPRAGY